MEKEKKSGFFHSYRLRNYVSNSFLFNLIKWYKTYPPIDSEKLEPFHLHHST